MTEDAWAARGGDIYGEWLWVMRTDNMTPDSPQRLRLLQGGGEEGRPQSPPSPPPSADNALAWIIGSCVAIALLILWLWLG